MPIDDSLLGATTFRLDDEGRRVLEVNVTPEGVIMDAYDKDVHIGTIGMMADEWYDFIEQAH